MKKENVCNRFFNGLIAINMIAYTRNGEFNFYSKKVKNNNN